MCLSAKLIPTPLTTTDVWHWHTSIPTDGLSVQQFLPTDPQSVYRGCGIVNARNCEEHIERIGCNKERSERMSVSNNYCEMQGVGNS